MKDKFILHDSFELKISKTKCRKISDSLDDGKALVVKIRATHGGYINGNKYNYTIDSMHAATDTWLKPFKKPVLVHHKETKDAIGRVIDSEFVPISSNRKTKPKGYVLLTLRVTDKEAIEKILDGRYMTVSVSSVPNSAICNICDNDLMKDGPCSHRRGKTYDDVECSWTIDIKEYTEVSFVNKPADEYQQGVESTQLTDYEEDDFNFSIDINKAEFELEDMKTIQDEVVINNKSNEKEDNKLYLDEVDGTWAQDDIDMINWLMDEMEKEDLGDAKLTTAKRKKLASSTFCGPNKSFPIPDCAHVTTARRLIGKYKGPGDKSRILACVERKAKALGCKTTTKTKDSNGDNNMEEKIKELETQISDLKKKEETQTSDLSSVKQEKEDLEKQLADKAKEIESLNDKIIKFEADEHSRLVDKIYSLRVKLGKNDVKDLSDEETSAYKENLSKRTRESLTDSETDLNSELKNTEKPNEPTETVNKESVDNKEKGTKIVDGEITDETDIKDLGDIIKGE